MSSVILVFSGAVGALALAAVAWGIWMWSRQQAAPAPSAAPVVEVAVDTAETEIASAPELEPPAIARWPAAIEPAGVSEEAPSERPKTPEERLAERARASAEQFAEQEEDDDPDAERERAYMQGVFDRARREWMGMIDGYFEQPDDKRDEYLRTAGEEFRKRMEAERLAAGLPAQPRNPGRVWMEVMRMNQEQMTDEEKARVMEFANDIVQRQMARFKAQMERQLGVAPQQ
jgi:hypothetical protein